MQTDLGQPRPRHQYTYHPRPYPGQKGVLTYSGPLNLTAATQGYGYGGYGGYGAYGYGAGYGTAAYGAYGAAPVGGVCSSSYTTRRTAYQPHPSSYSYHASNTRTYQPQTTCTGYTRSYNTGCDHHRHSHGHGCQCYTNYGWYANLILFPSLPLPIAVSPTP
jgi:hypothetical protein